MTGEERSGPPDPGTGDGGGGLRRSGLLRRRAAALATTVPAGPFRPGFWRSPIRGRWLTSVLGLVLLAGISIEFVTGLFSYAAYNPRLGALNDQTPGKGILGFYLFTWPTHPSWLYRLNQGVHVTLGVVLVPVLLAKLWSVIPKLFSWPPPADPHRPSSGCPCCCSSVARSSNSPPAS